MAIRLRGLTWDDPRGWGPLGQVGRAFAGTPAGSEVSVAWDIQPLEGFESAPLPELASRYDLINMDHPHVGEAVADGCLLPIDGLAEEYVGPSRASYELHGALWAVPIDGACQVSAFHPRRIAKPPRACADIPRLAASGIRVASSLVGVHALMALLTLLAQAGHPLPAERERGLPPRAALHEAATLLRALCSHLLPQSLRWNPLQLLDAMARGRVDYALFTFAYVGFTRRGLRFHPVPALAADRPSGGAVVGGTGLAVSAGSAQAEAAVDFARFAGSLRVQTELWAQHGGQPAHRRAWLKLAGTDPFYRDLLPAMETSVIRPRFSGWNHLQSRAGNLVNGWLSDGEGTVGELDAGLRRLWESTAARPVAHPSEPEKDN